MLEPDPLDLASPQIVRVPARTAGTFSTLCVLSVCLSASRHSLLSFCGILSPV